MCLPKTLCKISLNQLTGAQALTQNRSKKMQSVTVRHNGKQTKIENVVRAAVTCANRSAPARAIVDYINGGRRCTMTVNGDVSIQYHN